MNGKFLLLCMVKHAIGSDTEIFKKHKQHTWEIKLFENTCGKKNSNSNLFEPCVDKHLLFWSLWEFSVKIKIDFFPFLKQLFRKIPSKMQVPFFKESTFLYQFPNDQGIPHFKNAPRINLSQLFHTQNQ